MSLFLNDTKVTFGCNPHKVLRTTSSRAFILRGHDTGNVRTMSGAVHGITVRLRCVLFCVAIVISIAYEIVPKRHFASGTKTASESWVLVVDSSV
jgi:hypothetical protein